VFLLVKIKLRAKLKHFSINFIIDRVSFLFRRRMFLLVHFDGIFTALDGKNLASSKDSRGSKRLIPRASTIRKISRIATTASSSLKVVASLTFHGRISEA